MGLICQFVDSISATPTNRLRLDVAPWTTLAATDLGFPEMRRAVASTLLTDGATVPASAYGVRTLNLRLQVKTASEDDTATELQKLIRELNRAQNILKMQMGTAPVFFRTYRSTPDSWRIHTDGSFVDVAADVLAEPFAYGVQETPVSAVTVQTDPASGAGNACFVDVTGVKGDVETPAFIRWPSASVLTGRQSLFAVRRRGTPASAPFLFQAEAMTQGTDTTTQPNDANFSGAGNNYSRCTFTTATMQTRVSTIDLGTAGVDLRGRYRVLLRYRKNTSGDGINLKLRWGDADNVTIIENDVYATPATTTITTADLGEISVPLGYDPVYDGVSGVELAVSDAFLLQIQAERTSGSGTIDFDFVVLLPADDRLGIVQWGDHFSSASDHWMLDAATNTMHARDSTGRAHTAPPAVLAGGLPMLTPNQTNRVYMLRSITPGTSDGWTFTTVSNVYVSYWPRYLTVRPAST